MIAEKYDYKILMYYYKHNIISYNNPLFNQRRLKVWTAFNTSIITGIELYFKNENELLSIGEIKEVNIKVSNKLFFKEIMDSGYKVFFGEIMDIRLGEIILIIKD